MGARQKLNSACFMGSLLLAIFVGWFFGSWWACLGSLVVLLVLSVYSGDIRPGKGGRRR
jgi:hypothetical protein